MGLFDAFRKPAWQKAKQRGARARARSDLAAAHAFFEEALSSCPDEEREALEEARDSCAAELYESHMVAGEQYEQVDRLDQAVDRFQLARQFASDEAQRERAEAALRRVEQTEKSRRTARETGELAIDEALVDDAQAFEILTASLPPDAADRYHDKPPEFRTAFLAVQDGRADDGLEVLEAAASAPDADAIDVFEYGRCLRVLERDEEALEAMLRAEEMEPGWNYVRIAAAETAWSLERYKLAEQVLERALETDDDDDDVYAAVCRTALLTETPEYGLEASAVMLEKNANSRRFLMLRGQLLELAGRTDEAIDCYEQVVARQWRYDSYEDRLIFDHDSAMLALRGYLRAGHTFDRAEELARALVSVAPEQRKWWYMIWLGRALLGQKRREEAEEVLRTADRQAPDDARLERLRIAELLGDDERVAAFREELTDEEREKLAAREADPDRDDAST